jgi:hypothetical protein
MSFSYCADCPLFLGQDIVVIASTPSQASEVVLGLASLIIPYGASVGDLRPYMVANDSDLDILAAIATLKQSSNLSEGGGAGGNSALELATQKIAARNKSMIVGICDPLALQKLDDFNCAVFVIPPPSSLSSSTSTAVSDMDSIFKGMRTKNAADFVTLKPSLSATSSLVKASGSKRESFTVLSGNSNSATIGGKSRNNKKLIGKLTNENVNFFTSYFNNWLKEMKKSFVICRQEPTAFVITR